MNIIEALAELRKSEKRKFNQSVDLIINLKGIDLRKDNISAVIQVPNKIKDKKVCGFFGKKNTLVTTITEPEFARYKDKNELKKLVKGYDFFIASGPLMPKVATVFGKILGPAGKMPSPQLGILMQENDNAVKEVLEKISKSVKFRVKEASIKLSIGKESMKDEEIIENASAIYKGVLNALPNKNDNVRNVMIKLTMGEPVKVEMK